MPGIEIALWEFLGTGALMLLGVGVCANLTLRGMPGTNQGWLMGSITWGFAVFVGASIASPSGGHLNPAVSIGAAVTGGISWADLPWYFLGEFTGAFVGAVLAYLAYKRQFDQHDDHSNSIGMFSTMPAIRSPFWNLTTEIIATFLLVLFLNLSPVFSGSFGAGDASFGNSALGYAGVAFIIIAIGNGLGGPTGYALNPARDLSPRIAYSILPISGKGDAGWWYAWVPVAGPIIGAVLASLVAISLP